MLDSTVCSKNFTSSTVYKSILFISCYFMKFFFSLTDCLQPSLDKYRWLGVDCRFQELFSKVHTTKRALHSLWKTFQWSQSLTDRKNVIRRPKPIVTLHSICTLYDVPDMHISADRKQRPSITTKMEIKVRMEGVHVVTRTLRQTINLSSSSHNQLSEMALTLSYFLLCNPKVLTKNIFCKKGNKCNLKILYYLVNCIKWSCLGEEHKSQCGLEM